jgi:hypothetical protein
MVADRSSTLTDRGPVQRRVAMTEVAITSESATSRRVR